MAAFGGECSRERDIATCLGSHDRRQWETDTFVATYGGGNCQGERTSHGRRQDFDTETIVAYPLRAQSQSAHDESLESYIATASAVRRLTPRECERLQGFPDGYTAIPWRGKPASECPDGPRYKALGNSMAVPVMRWLCRRIETALYQ